MKRIFRADNVAYSLDGWVVYPDWGCPHQFRYEESGPRPAFESPMGSKPIDNRVLLFGVEYLGGTGANLFGSEWRWEPPFQGDAIDPPRRLEIVSRLRAALEHLGYSVSMTADFHLGDLEQPRLYDVFMERSLIVIRRRQDGAIKSLRIAFVYQGIELNLGELKFWDHPRSNEPIDEQTRATILEEISMAASRAGKSVTFLKSE